MKPTEVGGMATLLPRGKILSVSMSMNYNSILQTSLPGVALKGSDLKLQAG
jgi:hypothetical protein